MWMFLVITAGFGRPQLHCWWTLLAYLFQCENLLSKNFLFCVSLYLASLSEWSFFCTCFQIIDPGGIANWSVTHVDWSERKWHPKLYKSQDITSDLLKNITVQFCYKLLCIYVCVCVVFINKSSIIYACGYVLLDTVSAISWSSHYATVQYFFYLSVVPMWRMCAAGHWLQFLRKFA